MILNGLSSQLPIWFMQIFSIRDVFFDWEVAGVFDLLLPFLLIFAVIFGVLSSTNILGSHKGINVLIAFVIGLMAVRFVFVSDFLSLVFPKLAVGVVAILVLLILVGLFIPDDERKFWTWGLGAIGFGIAVFIVFQTIDILGWGQSSGYWGDYSGWIFGAILIIGLIIAVGASGGGDRRDGRDGKSKSLGQALFSEWRN